MTNESKGCIGITLGDPAGIGPEVTASALAIPSIRRLGRFKLIGDAKTYRKYFSSGYKNCSLVDLKEMQQHKKWQVGKPSKSGAQIALNALQKSIELYNNQEISCLVTAPLCKESITQIYPSFQGHTEFLAEAFHKKCRHDVCCR